MYHFEHQSHVDAGAQSLYQYHCNPGALERLTPPWDPVRSVENDQGIGDGLVRTLLVGPGPFKVEWKALHEDFRPGEQFVDRMVKGPFRNWVHTHRFLDEGEGQSTLLDHIEYEFPLKLPLKRLVEGRFRRSFRFRHRQTSRDLELINRYSDGQRLRVGITGSGGFLGHALSSFLKVAGHEVVGLRRGFEGDHLWWPEPDPRALEGFDAVVHLAGETVGQPWTQSVKEEIYFSRVEGTRRLCRALADLEKPPQVLISGSAIGYYDQRLDHEIDESGPCGDGFLSQVCRDWEAATAPAEEAGIRVCHARTGLVLSARGGFLALQIPAFRVGLGAVLGSGRQMQSFVDLDDWVGGVYHLIRRPDVSGPVNLTAPHPVSQDLFARRLAKDYSRAVRIRVPEKAGRLILGEQAEMAFDGVAAKPRRLLESGYRFLAPQLGDVFRHHLGR